MSGCLTPFREPGCFRVREAWAMKRFLLAVGIVAVSGCGLLCATGTQARTFDEGLFSQMQWRPIGPLRGGRGRAVAGVPSQPNVFYIGNDDGGVWKSTDYGNSWHPVFDD